MRIGIDSRLLSEKITCIGRYLSETLRLMIKNHPTYEFFLYSHKPIINIDTNIDNVNVRSMSFTSTVGRMLWSQSILPYQAIRDNLDVFWGPSHRLPFLLSNRVPMVLTIHDFVWKRYPKTMRMHSRILDKYMVPMAIKRSDCVICVSNATKSDLLEIMPDTKIPVKVIYLGSSLINSIQASDSSKYFLFVGTCEPRKNIERLIESFAAFKRKFSSEYKLIICGGRGWGGINANRIVFEHGMQDSVEIRGYVDDSELSTLYRNARALILASLYEGFGLPIIEAISYGVPSILSDVSSMPEVGSNTAMYVNPYSIDELTEAMGEMAFNDALRANLVNNCKTHSIKFDWSVTATQTMKVLQDAAKGKDL